MKYLGSKRRIASELNAIMQPYYKDYRTFVDAFCGGNLIKAITHPNRIAYDINEYVIAYFNALKSGWLPPKDVSEELYKDIKNNKEKYPKELVCFVGFSCSFGGKWFGGYARDRVGNRNFANEGYNYALNKDLPYINPITFINSDYRDIAFTEPSIIYCDPPYKNTTGYGMNFNHDEFYEWCRKQKLNSHKVFISEYEMPNDFKCIWSKEQNVHLDNNKKIQTKIERLFTL